MLGTAKNLFPPLVGDDFLDLLGRTDAAIGIFGTHFRELLLPPSIKATIDRLDIWFARNEDDMLMHGRGRANVEHLGDWLIEQFPLARASIDEPLRIREDIGQQRPLDRTIQLIQQRKAMVSTRLHPFLRALASAGKVAYAEECSNELPGVVSSVFPQPVDRYFR